MTSMVLLLLLMMVDIMPMAAITLMLLMPTSGQEKQHQLENLGTISRAQPCT